MGYSSRADRLWQCDRVAWETPATGQLGPRARNRPLPSTRPGSSRRSEASPDTGPTELPPGPPAVQCRESGPQPLTADSHVTAELNPLPRQAAGCVDGCPHPGAADPAHPGYTWAHTSPTPAPPAAALQKSRELGSNFQKLCLIVRVKSEAKTAHRNFRNKHPPSNPPTFVKHRKRRFWVLDRRATQLRGTCRLGWGPSTRTLQPALASPSGGSPGQQVQLVSLPGHLSS